MIVFSISKILSVQQQVALSQNNVSSIAELVLLTNVYHIEVLFVVEFELLSTTIKVSESSQREEWPHDEFFDHDLARDHAEGAGRNCVEGWSDVAVVDVLSSDHICPVSLDGSQVLIWLLIEKFLLDEVHSEVNGCLMLLWNASICLVEMVEVILVTRLQLLSQKNRHNKI